MTLTVEEWREVYRALDKPEYRTMRTHPFATELSTITVACKGQEGDVTINLQNPVWMFVVHETDGELRDRMRRQLVFYECWGEN